MDIKDKENDFITLQSTPIQIQSPARKSIHSVSPRASSTSLNNINNNNSPLADITLSKKSSFNQLSSTTYIYSDKNNTSMNLSRSPSPKRSPIPKKSFSKLPKQKTIIYGDEHILEDNGEMQSLQKNYTRLERLYADQMLKNSRLFNEQERLEIEIIEKEQQILSNFNKLSSLTHSNNKLNEKLTKQNELNEKEVSSYKEIKYNLERKIKSLQKIIMESEHERNNSNITRSPTKARRQTYTNPRMADRTSDIGDLSDIAKLSKEYKLLLTNYELEKNSKLILIDQIELLTKENYELIEQFKLLQERYNSLLEESNHLKHIDHYSSDDLTDLNIHSSNISKIDQDAASDDDGRNQLNEENFNTLKLSSLADELQLLEDEISELEESIGSPSSPNTDSRNTSIHIENGFKFPNPDSSETANQSQYSNPISTSNSNSNTINFTNVPKCVPQTPTLDEQLNFALSPFKLSSQSPNHLNRSSSEPRPTRGHSRYNSLDLLPIKVEFQERDDDRYNPEPKKIESIHEEYTFNSTSSSKRNSALFSILPSVINENAMKKNSSAPSTSSRNSSKRSSLILSPREDLQKQEIMKLKFELQSLKLHNEKLLSYIGFQLQNNKHSKNKDDLISKIEYSDAKLIENSKRLIHQKRILRAVSINPIMAKDLGSNKQRRFGLQNNLIHSSYPIESPNNSTDNIIQDDFIKTIDEEIDSNSDVDEDEYGFLKTNQGYGKRVLSNGIYNYLEYEKTYGYEFPPIDMKKKRNKSETPIDVDKNDKDANENESESDIEAEDNQSLIRQIKSIKQFIATDENDGDNDNLKYKFLSIAIGILIIGLKFHSNHYYIDIHE